MFQIKNNLCLNILIGSSAVASKKEAEKKYIIVPAAKLYMRANRLQM